MQKRKDAKLLLLGNCCDQSTKVDPNVHAMLQRNIKILPKNTIWQLSRFVQQLDIIFRELSTILCWKYSRKKLIWFFWKTFICSSSFSWRRISIMICCKTPWSCWFMIERKSKIITFLNIFERNKENISFNNYKPSLGLLNYIIFSIVFKY